jgi:phosphoserine phosphatase RsbU/P
LTTPQVPIAMFNDYHFATAGVTCEPGDLLVILTDGLTEVFDSADDEFGLDRLKELIRASATAPLESIEERVFSVVGAHGAQLDDQTLLLIRAVG